MLMNELKSVTGLHHVTAFCGDPQRNVDFYAGVLGLRTIKVTVNHDDVKTYHLYYGTGDARPGSFITFFPWPEAYRGKVGNGQSVVTAYSVPPNSLHWWHARLAEHGVVATEVFYRLEDKVIAFEDFSGARVELVESGRGDERGASPWGDVPADYAILGFHSVEFLVPKHDGMDRLLTQLMGYRLVDHQKNRYRYAIGEGQAGEILDLVVDPEVPFGRDGVGTTHHVAFRVPTDVYQLELREQLESAGLRITEQIDRHYFKSLYFRTPGGPLFEIATDPPGMTYDEPMETLGHDLVFPAHAVGREDEIRQFLPKFTTPDGVSFP